MLYARALRQNGRCFAEIAITVDYRDHVFAGEPMKTIEKRPKKATKAGCENLGRMIMALKEAKGLDWFTFTDWLSERANVQVSKDILYRTASGFHKSAPNMETLVALGRTPEFTYLDSEVHPGVAEVIEIVLGERDAYGQPIPEADQVQEDD
jgi:Fe-S oxidoreductase